MFITEHHECVATRRKMIGYCYTCRDAEENHNQMSPQLCVCYLSFVLIVNNHSRYNGLNVSDDVPYIWTSGRLCDFKGCEGRSDLEPKNIFGWFWSANREKIFPTNQTPAGWGYNPWSQTGHKKQRQPDNAEFDINGTTESCLSILNNVYNDGIAWHDVACYHEKPIVCEDSDELLNYVASTNRGLRL